MIFYLRSAEFFLFFTAYAINSCHLLLNKLPVIYHHNIL